MTNNKHPRSSTIQLDQQIESNKTRWVMSRKVAVVEAIRLGQISREQACREFALSDQELASWEKAVAKGKKTKNCKCYSPNQACAGCAKFLPIQSKLARMALSWTLPQAAEATGISLRSLTRFEGNEFLGVDLLEKLRAAYEAHGLRFWIKGKEIGLSVVMRR